MLKGRRSSLPTFKSGKSPAENYNRRRSLPSSKHVPAADQEGEGDVEILHKEINNEDRLKEEYEAMVPCTLSLNGNKLSMTNGCSWVLEDTEASESRQRITSLEEKLGKKDEQIKQLKASIDGVDKQVNTSKFKAEVLLDMLAVSQADENRTRENLEKEKIKVIEYQRELKRVYELCEAKGIDIGR